MKKKIYAIITLLSLGLLITCMILRGTQYTFNSANVKNNIEYLSSSEFKGRLTGSSENYIVGDEISKLFKEYKLTPLSADYEEGFSVVAPILNGDSCYLRILDGDTVIKEFKCGEDFKEDLVNFKTSKVSFTSKDTVDIYQKSISIKQDGKEYLFYVSFDKEFSFRSSFVSNIPFEFAIAINTDTYNYILDSLRTGKTLDVQLPYSNTEKEVYNIAGKIEGTNSELPPLVLTAHYDHVGIDSTNSIYPGALDNASGTAFLLELARKYSSLKAPERDIVFVALNAEEFGLLGSQAFVKAHKEELKDAEVINFDMVGVENFPITFMSGIPYKDNPTELEKDLKEICKNNNLSYDEKYMDASDHASFTKEGIEAITISHSDMSKIHTPKDVVANISTDSIAKVYSLVDNKILADAYNSKMLLFYNAKVLILFSLTTFMLVGGGFYFYYRKKKNVS